MIESSCHCGTVKLEILPAPEDVVMVNPIASWHRNLWQEADKVLTFAH